MPTSNDLYYYLKKHEESTNYPIILIHGAGGHHLTWSAGLRRLEKQNIYTIDLPGHGRSGGHGKQRIQDYSDSVIHWMDSLKLNRGFVFGHSMGGQIALDLSLRYPYRIVGLGLISTGARLTISQDLLDYSATPATFNAVIELLRKRSFSPSTNPRLVELALKQLKNIRPSVLHNDLQASAKFNAIEDLKMLQKPALIICGKDDQLTPPRNSQLLANRITGARFEILPNAGHMVQLEKPTEVKDIIAAFIMDNRRRL